MLHVELENILTENDAAGRLSEILQRADEQKELFVITRNGKAAVAVVNLEKLEELSGHQVKPTDAPPTAPVAPQPTSPAVSPAPSNAVAPSTVTNPVTPPATSATLPAAFTLTPPEATPSSLPDMPEQS